MTASEPRTQAEISDYVTAHYEDMLRFYGIEQGLHARIADGMVRIKVVEEYGEKAVRAEAFTDQKPI